MKNFVEDERRRVMEEFFEVAHNRQGLTLRERAGLLGVDHSKMAKYENCQERIPDAAFSRVKNFLQRSCHHCKSNECKDK